MTERIQISGVPAAYKAYVAFAAEVEKAAEAAGLPKLLVELMKLRASQINGCAFCLDMHSATALKAGESQRRLNLLAAWRETDLYTEQERAALDVTEALTRLSETRDLPDDVYSYATKVLTEEQYQVVVWLVVMINGWNRVAVPGHPKLPNG